MKGKHLFITMAAALVVFAAGCGKKEAVVEVTPTPAPTATPVPTATPTPLPTATPAPRRIGQKTSTAKYIYLTNNIGAEIRQFYIKASEDGEWGRNLIPSEFSIKTAEQVQVYYAAAESEDAVYDIQLMKRDGTTYEIYSVELGDMEKATLRLQDDTAYLTYMSLSEKKQKDTKENEPSYDYDEDDYDDSYYDNSYNNGSSGNTSSGGSGNGSTGDGNTGNGNTGDGNTGNGNTGDGNTGNGNTGDGNTGNGNTGNGNTGNGNTGNGNTGDGNTGNGNTGNGNTGNGSTGDGNTGNGGIGNGDYTVDDSGTIYDEDRTMIDEGMGDYGDDSGEDVVWDDVVEE